jgi:N-acetylneuraminate lyase
MSEKIEGLIAAPLTAMNADRGINLDAIEKQADLLHRNGVAGAFVCGTTGEGLSLTLQERLGVVQRWIDTAPEGFKVIVHVGHNSIEACKIMAAHAQKLGAWGFGAMGPCFFQPRGVEQLVGFCAAMAAAAPDLPYYYYHMPDMTGVRFPMLDFLEAARDRIPNLAGVKFTYEVLMDFELCRKLDDGRFDMLFGRDEMLLAGLALGARGAIGSTYNFATPLYLRIIDAFDNGDLDTARLLQRKSMAMIKALNRYPGGSCVWGKAAMKMIGIDCGPCRLPLQGLNDQEYEALQATLAEQGFFEFCSK